MKMKNDLSHGGIQLARAVEQAYAAGQTDYSMEPLVRVDESGTPVGVISPGDGVIFCCRRGEREIELTEAFTDINFPHFQRLNLAPLEFVILTLYHEKFKDLPVAFLPSQIKGTLAEAVSRAGLSQFHCAESEKFAHVTFFLNGGNNQPFHGETDERVPSPKGIPFDQVPQLNLPEVTREVNRAIQAGYDLIVTNFANGDVIGHTSNRGAKIQCAEALDRHLGEVVKTATTAGYVIAVTADHGNLEQLFTEEGKPHVSHTANPVPLVLIDPKSSQPLRVSNGKLADLAPTILSAMGLNVPDSMTGNNLIANHEYGERRKVLLIILDGWGIGKDDDTNPIFLARTPTWDGLLQRYGLAQLQAAGEDVGLRAGKNGNSEAGHLNIGAGRIIEQDDVRLDNSLGDGTFSKNEVFLHAIDGVLQRKTSLHLIGLLTEKSSHGCIDYPLALLQMASEKGLQEVYLHLIFDGRSTEPGSAPALLEKLEHKIAAIGVGQIVTAVGRGIALDRDGNYTRIKKAYDALVLGMGQHYYGG